MSLTLLAISGFFIDIKKFSQAIILASFFSFYIFGYLFTNYVFINGFLPDGCQLFFLYYFYLINLFSSDLLLGQSQILDEVRQDHYIYMMNF